MFANMAWFLNRGEFIFISNTKEKSTGLIAEWFCYVECQNFYTIIKNYKLSPAKLKKGSFSRVSSHV